jgi:hypothetical protein
VFTIKEQVWQFDFFIAESGESRMAAIRSVVACWLLIGPLALVSWADDDQARLLYSQGVHAYFDGLYPEAKDLLSQSIDKNSSDPRPYYFRGVIHQLMGDSEQGGQDIRSGAQLESTSAGRAFDIGVALERIQGPMRMEIETCRREAFSQAALRRKNQSSSAGRSVGKANAAKRGAFDSKNLPDVSAIADPSVPFPDTTAKAYFPPVKSATAQQDAIINAALSQPAAAAAAKTPPADDPFSGGNATKKTDQPAPKSNQDDPFGGGGGGDEPNENAPESGEPPAKSDSDDPFSGG